VGFKRLFRKILNPKSGKRKLGKQAVSGSSFQTKSWKLSKEKTRKLLKKCKENEVKVHSAVCTAFALDFSEINNPVNLRNRLDRDIRGEVGLFASGLILKTKYTQETNFWDNARTYQRRLTKALKSDKVFQVFKVFSRAVPKSRLQKFSPLFVELLSNKQAFAITNIGNLDRMGTFRGRNKREKYEIENFFGGVSETFDVIMVTVLTAT